MLTVRLRRNGYLVVKTPLGDVTVWNLDHSESQVGVEAPRDWAIQRDDVEYRDVEGNNGSAAVSNGRTSQGAR